MQKVRICSIFFGSFFCVLWVPFLPPSGSGIVPPVDADSEAPRGPFQAPLGPQFFASEGACLRALVGLVKFYVDFFAYFFSDSFFAHFGREISLRSTTALRASERESNFTKSSGFSVFLYANFKFAE